MELELLKLFFPEELVAYFNITGSAIKRGKHGDYLEVEITERNELLEGYSSEEYEAKDFVEKTIQDFPIRSHARRERVLNPTLQYAQNQLFTRTLFAKSTR